eukprot:2640882-Alexandrium_andersonii.AAC.1
MPALPERLLDPEPVVLVLSEVGEWRPPAIRRLAVAIARRARLEAEWGATEPASRFAAPAEPAAVDLGADGPAATAADASGDSSAL